MVSKTCIAKHGLRFDRLRCVEPFIQFPQRKVIQRSWLQVTHKGTSHYDIWKGIASLRPLHKGRCLEIKVLQTYTRLFPSYLKQFAGFK